MNASSRIVLWALMGLLFPLQIASAQDHQITPWKHNYAAAASLGFDDGLPSQVDYAVPLLNARGLKATFFVVPSGVPVIPTGGDVTWDQWRQVAAQGHEIGSQSFSDPDLTTLTDSDLRYQLSQSQLVINQNIPSQSCITLAYPFGTSNSHVQAVTSEYYATGRGAWAELEGGDLNFYEDPDPAWPLPPNVDLGSYKAVNFFDIAGNNLRDTLPLSNIYNKLDFAIAHNAWYDMYVHDIDSGFSSDDLAALLDYIVARNIWMARLGEVAQYMRERKESTLSVLSSDSSAIQLSLTNSLNGLLYTESLTIRSIVPSAWLNVSITQGSSSTTIASTVEGASTVVYYDALPNGGTIVLTQAGPLSGVSMSPATVQGGVSSTGTVTLNTPAPAGGAVVSLTSSDTAAARVPALVTVLAGATTATFTATTSPVASNETVTITALYNSVSRTATLTVTVTAPVAALSGVSVSPTSVQGGASSTGTVTLDAPAPAGGAAVSLTSSNTAAAQVPGSVTVLAGATTAAFTATTSPVASDAAVTITALYNSVSRTATLTVTAPAPAPDFSLSAIPASQAVLQGTPGSYTLTINPTNGFTGAVTLSVSGLPAGATGSFTPNPATGSSTLAVTTSSSTPVGTYTLTVTGVSGSLNHTTTVSLSVVTTLPPPGVAFDAVGPSAGGASVASGSSLSWNHTVGANGMNLLLMVGVAVGAMPDTGHSLAVTYNSVPMTSVGIVHSNNQTYGYVQLFYLTAPAVGTYPVQVTLSGGTASLEAGSVSFTGVDPTTPVRNIATSFGSGVSPKVTVTSTPGDMVVDALVTGCNGTITSGKTLRWLKQVNCATAGGNGAQSTAAGASSVTMGYTVPSDSWGMIGADIVAAGGQPIDFTLGNEGDKSVVQGSAVTNTLTATLSSGSTQNVTFSASGLPAGVTASFNPAGCSPTCGTTLTISAGTSAPLGTAPITVTATAGSVSRTTTFTLNVTAPPDFSLSAIPASQTVVQGASGSYPLTINPTNGFTGAVTLSVSGLPTGAGGSFNTNPATSTSTLSVTTDAATTPAGSYTLTITGVSGSLTHTTTVTLVVTAPDFTLSPTPASQTVARGTPTSYGVTINPTNGFAGQVTLSVSGLPTGAGGSFNTNPATSTSTLSVTTDAATTPAGSYTLTITGVSGSLTHTTTVTLVVTAPDFTLSPTPASQTVARGNPTSYGVTINPTNGFAGQVTLSVSGLPTGAGGSFNTNPATSTSTLSVTTDATTTPAGSYTLTITGVSGSLTHTTTVTLVVTAPDFTLTGSPASQTVVPGSPTSYTATVTPTNGFTGQVTLSVSGLPTGANGSFSPNPATSTSTLSVTTSASTPTGTYTLTFTGVSGSLTHTANVTLVVATVVSVQSLTLSPASVVGGSANSTGTVTLNAPAAVTTTVTLSSGNTAAATVPASVSVAAGATTATFTVTSKVVSTATNSVITATLFGSATATLAVNPFLITALTLNRTSVVGGTTSATGTITLNAPSAGTTAQRTVTLASDNTAAATVPASVTFTAGATTKTFTVTSLAVLVPTVANISATLNGSSLSVALTVTPPAAVQSLSLSPASVVGGSNSIGTVTLTVPAAGSTSQRTVTLTSSNTAAATVPASVTVASGATTATFTVKSLVAATVASSVITATLNGSATATLTVNPLMVTAITLNPSSVKGGSANSIATITLNGAAAGTTAQRKVTLLSSNTAWATVPASVTVASGATTATFTVTSKVVTAIRTPSISASINGGMQSATLTVTP